MSFRVSMGVNSGNWSKLGGGEKVFRKVLIFKVKWRICFIKREYMLNVCVWLDVIRFKKWLLDYVVGSLYIYGRIRFISIVEKFNDSVVSRGL